MPGFCCFGGGSADNASGAEKSSTGTANGVSNSQHLKPALPTEQDSQQPANLKVAAADDPVMIPPAGTNIGPGTPKAAKAVSSVKADPTSGIHLSEVIVSRQPEAAADSAASMPPWFAHGSGASPGSGSNAMAVHTPGNSADHALPTKHNTASVAEILRVNLGEVKLVLQKLASLNSTPTIALNEAAELLCKHLAVSMCSITGLTDHCTSFVLLAAYGAGAAELEKTPVMRGTQWSASMLLEQPLLLHHSVNSPEAAANLPADFQVLYQAGGLRSFLSIPIATDHEVVGVLTIAKEEVDGFEVEWWEPMLGCLGVGLLSYLRNEQTQQLCQLTKALDIAPEYTTLIHSLLRGAHTLLLRATNIRTGCRLALLGTDPAKALIFEPDRKFSADPLEAAGAAGAAGAQLHVTEIQLENTLLLDAVQKGKARFVSDCASYIQSCMKPATDIFISGQEMVASIVVLPLIYDGVTFGGFYVTLETTSNFQNIKDLLMGFVNSVVLVLSKKLQPQRDAIWEAVSTPGQPANRLDEATASGNHDDPMDSNYSNAAVSGMLNKPLVVKRSCTEAMLKVLQHELRKTHAKSQALEWIDELMLQEIVGKGGFGVVYKGTWKGSVAAIKVMYARQHERQAMKDALEMAVLTTVSHPNIIQVYNCFTDMVEDASGTNQPMQEGKINVRFRRLQPDEDRSLATCNILVMEYCDKASLRHAMKKGVFHKRLGNTSVAVDLCAIVQVLVEVAQAIQHLHLLKLIHCDIKPENVLLKSDGGKGMGFVTKLSDFGLAKLLRENYYIVNRSGSGTVTHLAPELFQVGSKLTTAVDTFSFGIMMWELYTGQRAYGGLGRDAIIDRVYKKKARPIFPLGVPQMYAALAKACWDNDPTARPTFVTVLSRLAEMLTTFQNASGGGGGGGGGANIPAALPPGGGSSHAPPADHAPSPVPGTPPQAPLQ